MQTTIVQGIPPILSMPLVLTQGSRLDCGCHNLSMPLASQIFSCAHLSLGTIPMDYTNPWGKHSPCGI
jgi:hypothetical protein